ncbi:peptide/nickel transport system permease protein [Parasporobacterium paucivorans DSM 15970]|uniref:Peptide/nickel transport system permease protein n=1 Tax=Parasporobacterium paucivorans DSM 15970 TaxID=1122934 RepID=A0A1M6KWB6_9FIRM|nr:ABC transporter permease [Parasporobacterium paucivorans]SHJ63184.1 peptide/nickel transport system permease protein [Parasporobacterium paucivorans DSM 15970]
MNGAGTTFFIALCTVLIGAVFGAVVGLVAGYVGGWFDEVVMRINDMLTAFPSILLALIFVSILGPGTFNIILALGILFIPSFARIVRSEMIRLKELNFVKSARLMGAGRLRIIFVHILPNTYKTLLTTVAVGFNNAVLAEAGMSYLGLGVQPPGASLGRMLLEAQSYLFTAPWSALFPGITIVVIILGFSLISEGLGEENA